VTGGACHQETLQADRPDHCVYRRHHCTGTLCSRPGGKEDTTHRQRTRQTAGTLCYPHSLSLRWTRPHSDMGKVNDCNTDRHSWMSDTHIRLFLHKGSIKLIHLYPRLQFLASHNKQVFREIQRRKMQQRHSTQFSLNRGDTEAKYDGVCRIGDKMTCKMSLANRETPATLTGSAQEQTKVRAALLEHCTDHSWLQSPQKAWAEASWAEGGREQAQTNRLFLLPPTFLGW